MLRALALGPLHGWGISERVQQMSRDALRIQQGSLYPSLHRLERRGWIKARWSTTEQNRQAKYYELTRAGRRELEHQQSDWARLTAAIARVLGTV
jgi:transcriptional regulator